jgi:hypothetical protein
LIQYLQINEIQTTIHSTKTCTAKCFLRTIETKLKKTKIIFNNFLDMIYILRYCGGWPTAFDWFCIRVLTKSNGNTQITPTIPAIPPLIIRGNNLQKNFNAHHHYFLQDFSLTQNLDLFLVPFCSIRDFSSPIIL